MSAVQQGLTNIIDDLLASLPAAGIPVRDVRVGPFWTVVWTERGAGLASTQRDGYLAGTRVVEPAATLAVAGQGAIFRQMRGVRLVTIEK